LPVGHTHPSSSKHVTNNTWHEPPHLHSIQRFKTSTQEVPIAGISQGNGAGPPIWATVSSPMFDIMRQDGFYALLTGAISHQQCRISGFVFVDDMDLCHSDRAEQAVQQMQNAVNHWDSLLWATGGALVPEKCF